MITRRETLQVAAAFAATRGAMFAVSPEEAAAALAAPAQREPEVERRFVHLSQVPTVDPVPFAQLVDGLDMDSDVIHDPRFWAAFKHSMLDIADAVRDGQDAAAILKLLDHLEDAAVDLATMSWIGGVRAGAAYEHLRLALAIPEQQCPACGGYGRNWEDRKAGKPASESAACLECGGQGFVSLRRPVLELTTD